MRCVKRSRFFFLYYLHLFTFLDQNLTFFWIDPDYNLTNPSNPSPYDYRDHNVLYIGNDQTAENIYETCNTSFKPNDTLPSGQRFKFVPDPPNEEHTFTMDQLGWNYFYCSLRTNVSDSKFIYHCKDRNVKAKVFVFDEENPECPIHINWDIPSDE